MATFVKVSTGVKVVVRRRGHPTVSKTFKRKYEAERWAREVETQIDTGTTIVPTKDTVGALFRRYSEEVSSLKPGARWEKVRIARLLRTATFTELLASEATYRHIGQWRDARLKEVAAPSVKRELALISSIFSHAIKEWHVPLRENPCSKVSKPSSHKPRNRRVLEHEVEAVLVETARRSKNRRYIGVAFALAVETGLRMSELCALRREDLHLDEGWIYVLPGKNGDERHVPLTQRAVELLKMLPEGGVFPFNAGTLSTEFRRVVQKLGINDLHFHDARHEYCSRMARVYTVLELAKVIGHRDLKSLMVYYNPTVNELVQKLRSASPATS
jgi:integrase